MEITISLLNINKFKGLRQDINYPELPLDYCHVCLNLNVDDSVGALKIRGGSVKKYNPALTGYPFTSLVSAFEYRFEESSETVLIVNDNGTLKTMTDGGAPASLTLPTGTTLESGFQNYYLGYKDHVLITTGNAATNYVLWYGYVDRENDDDTGLFGNVEENTGYIIAKSQLISPHGTFSNVYDTVHLIEGTENYYYFSFEGSKYVEKRDSDFHLISRYIVKPSNGTITPVDNANVALCKDSTGYIYAAYEYSTNGVAIVKINPSGWVQLAVKSYESAGHLVGGIATDGTMVYVAINDASGGSLKELNVADLTENTATAIDDMLDVACDNTATTGYVYVLKAAEITRRLKSTLGVAAHTNSDYLLMKRILLDVANSRLWVSSFTGDGHVYDLDPDDLTEDNDYANIDEPQAFINVAGANWRGISTKYGTVESVTSTPTYYPGLASINLKAITALSSGGLDTGTYWYKIAIEDTDGQIYTLSDPITVNNDTATRRIDLTLICHTDYLNELYRVKYINIFRAYNEDDDADIPSTDYKFLKRIDINSESWVADKTTNEVYYYDHYDDRTEDTISTTTYLEMAGIGDTVRPKYINGKYFTWINNQLHMANFSHDGETYRNRIIRSSDNAPDGLAFYDYYDFDVGVGEAINGITEMNGRAIIFKERKMGVFYDGRWEQTFIPGAHNSHAFTKVNDILYYVSSKGIHAFDGSRLINIHYPVIGYFDLVSKDTYPPNVFYVDKRDRLYFTMREGGVYVYNTRIKTWTSYTSGIAFYGCFKNYADEYIGWDSTSFYEFEDSTSVNDKEDYGAGGGTALQMSYESPLLRFSNSEGELVVPISHRHRLIKDVAVGSTDLVTFTLYEYQDDASARTSVYTQALDSPIGAYAATKNYFFDPIMGESFSIRLSATAIDGGNFEYHGLTIDYMPGGYWRGR